MVLHGGAPPQEASLPAVPKITPNQVSTKYISLYSLEASKLFFGVFVFFSFVKSREDVDPS